MPIDWSAYGVKGSEDNRQRKTKSKLSVDFNQYAAPPSPTPDTIESMTGVTPTVNVDNTPLMQNVQKYAASNPQPVTTQPAKQELPGRHIPLIGPVLRTIDKLADNPFSNAVAEYAMPNAGFIDQPNANVRQQFLQDSGIKPATGVTKLAGQMIAPFAVPGAQLGTGGAIEVATKDALKAVPASNLTKSIFTGAAVGGATGAGAEFAQGNGSVKDAAIQGAAGAVLGGGLAAAGTGLKGLIRGKSELPIQANQAADVQRPVTNSSEPTAVKGSLYTDLFGNQGVGIKSGVGGARRSGTGMQIVDNPLKKDSKTILDDAKVLGRAAKQDYVDSTAPLKHLGGDVQDIALDARRSNNLANTWVHDKAVTPEGVVIGDGLKDIIGKVPRGQADAFEDYLIVRHAKTRVARGERVYDEKLNMNDVDKLQARKEQLEQRYPGFKALGDKWDRYYENLRNTGKEYGLVSESQINAMREQNPNYASMRRQFSTAEKFQQPFALKTNSFSGQKAPIKSVSPTGSVRKIVSPVRSAIEQTGAWHNAGMRNRVMQSILKQVQENPEALRGVVELVDESSQATAKSLKEINDVLAKDGVEGLTEFLNNEHAVMFRKSSQAVSKTDNIVTTMVDGKPVKMRVLNPEIYKSLVGLAPEESNFVLNFFGTLSNATKRGATGALAPLFAAKAATVDVAQALLQSKDPLRHIPDLVHATVSSIANKLPHGTPGIEAIRALAQDFERTGGEYSAALRGEKPLKKAVGNLRKEPILSPKGIWKGTKAAVSSPFKLLEGVSDVAENVNRIAAYKGEMRRLGEVRTPENVRSAMRESQEITTNFSRKGLKGNTIEKFIPYSNAAIQGVRRFAVQLRDHPVKAAMTIGGMVIAPKLWEQSRFGDDPDYQKLPERNKYRNLIIGKNADGKFIQIPMPPEYEAIGAFASDMMAKMRGQNYPKWREASDALVNAYTPPFVSGALQGATQGGGIEKSGWGLANASSPGALIGTLANQNYMGSPIVSQSVSGNSPYMQKDERTSGVSGWLSGTSVGKKLGLSPMKMDYLLKQYGGDLARLGLPLTSDVGGGNIPDTLLKNFIVDPVFTNNLSQDYYDKIGFVKQIVQDVGDGATPPSWYNDSVKKLATGSAKGDPARQIRDLTNKKREIQLAPGLSNKSKADQLRQVQGEINNIYLDVTSKLNAMGVKQ